MPTIYLGFRVREDFDADLSDLYASQTSVYSSNGTGFNDYFETYWQGALATGQSLYSPLSGLTFRQLSINADGGSAVVSICRNTTTIESGALCSNGLDDDCDGLMDEADPTCGTANPSPYMPPNPTPAAPVAGENHLETVACLPFSVPGAMEQVRISYLNGQPLY